MRVCVCVCEDKSCCLPITGSRVAMKFFTGRPPCSARTAAARAFWADSGCSNRMYPDSSPILKSMNFTGKNKSTYRDMSKSSTRKHSPNHLGTLTEILFTIMIKRPKKKMCKFANKSRVHLGWHNYLCFKITIGMITWVKRALKDMKWKIMTLKQKV